MNSEIISSKYFAPKWAEFLRSKGLLETAEQRVVDAGKLILNPDGSSIDCQLLSAFIWGLTPEGFDFWKKIDTEFGNIPKGTEKSQAYQILSFIRDNYQKNELDILEEFIQETFPADFERFQSDNYDGPQEIDYDAPSQGEQAERMGKIQREIK